MKKELQQKEQAVALFLELIKLEEKKPSTLETDYQQNYQTWSNRRRSLTSQITSILGLENSFIMSSGDEGFKAVIAEGKIKGNVPDIGSPQWFSIIKKVLNQ